jgi:hypothetical protein
MNLTIKEIVKNNVVRFVEYRKGFLYYSVSVLYDDHRADKHLFPVPIEDCGDATFPAEEKAILFMRYIRKAIDDGTFVKI